MHIGYETTMRMTRTLASLIKHIVVWQMNCRNVTFLAKPTFMQTNIGRLLSEQITSPDTSKNILAINQLSYLDLLQ